MRHASCGPGWEKYFRSAHLRLKNGRFFYLKDSNGTVDLFAQLIGIEESASLSA